MNKFGRCQFSEAIKLIFYVINGVTPVAEHIRLRI